jgi:hypothetical protein
MAWRWLRWGWVLAAWLVAGPKLLAQEPTVFWRDGILYAEVPGGGAVLLGSITGTIEQTESDGTPRSLTVPQIPADFRPTPHDQDTPESIELRKHLQSVTRSIADSQRAPANRRPPIAGASDEQLSNDGLVYLVYSLDRARSLLDLSQTQYDQLKTIGDRYRQDMDKLRPTGQAPKDDNLAKQTEFLAQVRDRRAEMIAEISSKILLRHQIRPANLQSPEFVGIIRILGQTPIGESATLTPAQQDRLCEETTRIAVRLQQQIAVARQDMQKLLERELTPTQRARVQEFYPGTLERQIEGTSVEQFLRIITVPKKFATVPAP